MTAPNVYVCSNANAKQALGKSRKNEKQEKKETNFDFKGCAAASSWQPKRWSYKRVKLGKLTTGSEFSVICFFLSGVGYK